MQAFTKVSLDVRLTPENCVLVLIDHQLSQLANINSHDASQSQRAADKGASGKLLLLAY